MRIDLSKIGIFLSFGLAGWVIALVDSILFQLYISQFILFPFIILFIYFFTRYNQNRYFYLGLFILVYFLIFTIPLWLGILLLVSFVTLEKLISLSLNRFNIFQVLVISIVMLTIISIIYIYQLPLLTFFSWSFIIIDWSISGMQEYIIRIILGIIFSFIFYPFLSVYESKNKLYLTSN